MYNMDNLEPARVFKYFCEISKIPHGSFNTDMISDYLVSFAKEHNLAYKQDSLGNVIITKSGKGKPVIIQGHTDMVCEKAPDCDKDMSKEGLDLYVDGDKLRARGTTLGGDDGIAVAIALAILEMEDDTLPPIEAIFTVNEEVGMLGAAGIDVSEVKGRIMLNIDSEQEGVLTVSCAGGAVAKMSVPVVRENLLPGEKCAKISISGLAGGHSGIEIHKNRANAIELLGRVLSGIQDDTGIRLVCVSGGAKDNAIAVSAEATIVFDGEETGLLSVIDRMQAIVSNEYATTDKDIEILCQPQDIPDLSPMTVESTNQVIAMLTVSPNGIQRMSPDVDGLVQTSLNMGVLSGSRETSTNTVAEDKVTLALCLRSSVASEKDALMRKLRTIAKVIGGQIEIEGDYPGWQYMTESPLRDLMVEIFKEQYGREPVVEAVHAGVECGYFASKIPGLDCVSYGPELQEIHTFRESMDIPSVQRTYEFTLEILRRLARS